jgi:hypothetical protein
MSDKYKTADKEKAYFLSSFNIVVNDKLFGTRVRRAAVTENT